MYVNVNKVVGVITDKRKKEKNIMQQKTIISQPEIKHLNLPIAKR